ncbi:AAA family ATPase [Sporosarcina cascadiensis]|uniref:AAA family ATPase n=1 Tax=Sporosarcina cascadiensis TaxID=2660747 RepID=UPI00129AA659|nr:AAA family ATPase [Sporosarcina cascadiensis]
MDKIYQENELAQIKENYIVGTLATEEDNIPWLGDTREPVTYSAKMNDVIFFVKPLSQEPKNMISLHDNINKPDLYVGFSNRSISNLPFNFRNKNVDEQVQDIKDLLMEKLLVFKPVLTQKLNTSHKNIEDLTPEGDLKQNMRYYSIPNLDIDSNELETKLKHEEPIFFERYNHAMPAPLFILTKDNYIFGNIKEDQWRLDPSFNHSSRVIISPKTIKRVKIEEIEKKKYIGSNRERVVFFEDEFIDTTIADRLDSEGVTLDDVKNELDQQIEDKNPSDVIIKASEINSIHEITFLKDLELKAKSRNLIYSRRDLLNFHTSIKSSVMTILSGQSGIGKTKLATLYAEGLGLSRLSKNMLIIPISPAYTEPADILGYLNPSTGLYMPSETGLIDFLNHAERNENQVHFLIMDEMNLSQIEFYFAPFISLLELDETERFLQLYSENSICHNNQIYKSSIQLKDNLVIVGTMNTDETTKDLSDRLLDRSNIVVLEKMTFSEIESEINKKDVLSKENTGAEQAYGELFMSWKSIGESWNAFNREELSFFDEVDNCISSVDPLKGFSIRSLIKMGSYLNNLPSDENNDFKLDRRIAVDLFIKQRVITKIRGSLEEYETLIGTFGSNESEMIEGELYELFDTDRAKIISNFEFTKVELVRKARELGINGYAT